MGKFDMLDIAKWLGLRYFDIVVNIHRTCCDQSNGLKFVLCTRNCKQETIYYIQETKTIFEKFFAVILKRNRNL